MVGIVLVSHSRELSAAVKALADQQIQGRAPIVAVGGSDNPNQPFGTDPVAIAEAIQSVFSDEGVLVLMDLGSGVISGQVALDLLEAAQTAKVHLSVAPFVEGAMAAAVQASIGMDLEAVAREAEEALLAKQTVLQYEDSRDAPAHGWAAEEDAAGQAQIASADVIVVNPAGLHFGPAARFIQTAAAFQAEICVSNLTTGAGPAQANRFNQLLSLGVEKDHCIRISASGNDAEEAVNTLVRQVAHDVGESEKEATLLIGGAVPPPLDGNGRTHLAGLPASPGIAIGTVALIAGAYDPLRDEPDQVCTGTAAAEWSTFQEAHAAALEQLEALTLEIRDSLGEERSIIFRAHMLLLHDRDFLADIHGVIEHEGWRVDAAVRRTVLRWAERFQKMSGAVFQQRAADIEDVGRRLLKLLCKTALPPVQLPANAIIVADDLLPSQTAALDRSRVRGLCMAGGGPAAHSAILARSMGIPAVVAVGPELIASVREGVTLALDGSRGRVIVEPDANTTLLYTQAQSRAVETRAAAWAAAQRLTRTHDGVRVEVVANLGAAADAAFALEAGAEGIGLLRTEFLFQDRLTPPSEEEQFVIYQNVAQIMGDRPVVIRTLDIGGDKPAPYLSLPQEPNPFLGWRAMRISLSMPEFFKAQLRALLRAGISGQVKVMFPMICTIDEILRAQALVANAASELAAAGIPFNAHLPVGIMIETPAAVQIADQLAPLVDFFSIGTNDLTQYTFAADRTNPRVAGMADPLHPAMLRQIDFVLRAAHLHGRWVSLCGELAADVDAIPILLGLGLNEFSMAPASIPAAKQTILCQSMPAARRLAQRALQLNDAESVRRLVRESTGK